MNRKKIGWVLGVMVLAIVLVVPSVSRSLAVDLEENCSLSFKLSDQEFAEDLERSDMVVDVYKVAAAIEDPNYDSYSFEATEAFSRLTPALSDLSSVNYSALSQQAAQIVAEGGVSPVATVALADPASLEAGLYLTMPHNESASLADSIKQVAVGDGMNNLLTFVNTSLYKYEFNPSLVALPSRLGEDGSNNTANNDVDWQFDVDMTFKVSREYREGSIVINKTVDKLFGSGTPTFVFNITAERDGEIVYANVETISLSDSENGSVTLSGIPAGSTVTVEEVYTGASYTLSSGTGSQVLNNADEPLQFDFVNESKDTDTHQTTVNNRYTNNGESYEIDQEVR